MVKKFVAYVRDILFLGIFVALIFFLKYKFQLTSLELFVGTITIAVFLSIMNNFIASRLECQKLLKSEQVGVDKLCIQVNTKLLSVADPGRGGQLLTKIAVIRGQMVNNFGFILPNIRISGNPKLIDFEYKILVNDIFVDGGFVHPKKIMVSKSDWDNLNIALPEDCIKGINPIDKTEAYWLNESDIEEKQKKLTVSPADVIVNHLEKISIKYSSEIISHSDIQKYIKLLKVDNLGLIENFLPELLSISDLKKIFTNLIAEEISIKDIISVFEYLNDFARFSKNPDELYEKLRYAFKRQIQQKYVHDNKVYAITFSQDTEKQLETLINHSSDGERTDFKPIAHVILEALNNLEEKIIPVVLVSSKIRLQLYRYLNELIPSINVISYNELSQKTHIEIIKEISNEQHKIFN